MFRDVCLYEVEYAQVDSSYTLVYSFKYGDWVDCVAVGVFVVELYNYLLVCHWVQCLDGWWGVVVVSFRSVRCYSELSLSLRAVTFSAQERLRLRSVSSNTSIGGRPGTIKIGCVISIMGLDSLVVFFWEGLWGQLVKVMLAGLFAELFLCVFNLFASKLTVDESEAIWPLSSFMLFSYFFVRTL